MPAFVSSKAAASNVSASAIAVTGFAATLAVGSFVFIAASHPAIVAPTSGADNSSQAGTANGWTPVVGVSVSTPNAFRVVGYVSILTRSILTTDTIQINMTSPVARSSALVLVFTGVGPLPRDRLVQTSGLVNPVVVADSVATAQADELTLMVVGAYTGSGPSGFSDGTAGFTAIAGTNSGNGSGDVDIGISWKVETSVRVLSNTSYINGTSPSWGASLQSYKATASTPQAGGGGSPGGYKGLYNT